MKKFSEAVLAPHKHMSKKASPYHAHSQGLVYTPSGKEEIRPIDTADAGYGGEAVSDAEGGEADAGKASKKAVSPMKMQTLVKKTNEGFDPSSADIAKDLVAKHGKNVTRDHIRALENDRDSNKGLDYNEIMKHVKKLQEETERERLLRMRSFAYKQKLKGLGVDIHEPVNEAAPPGMEDWIMSAKPSFKKQYGKDWEKALYATAWKKHNDMKEEAEQIDELDSKTYQSYLANPSRQHPKIKDVIAARKAERGGDEKPIERLAKTVQLRSHALRKLKDRYMKSQPAPEPGPIGSRFDEEAEQVDELNKSTLASYAKKATDEVSYHSFTAGTMSPKDPERLETDKKAMKRQRGVERAVDKLAKEEVEQIDEMDKSQPSSSRGAEGLATGAKATPVTAKKAAADALKLLKKNVEPVKEEVELDEISQEARKNKMRTMGVNAAIQHPKKVDFAGGAIQMYRQAVKKLSSKEMSDVAKKLPKVNEEGYKLVAKTKAGETFTSKTHDTKAAAQQAHYKMAKGGGYKNIKLTKVDEQNDWNGPEEENDMAMTQLHFIKYAAEEIMDAIKVGTDMEEWYQNKLTRAHVIMEGLHSYMEGKKRHHGSLGDPVSEGKAEVRAATDQAVKDFMARGGLIKKFPPSKATHRPGTALASKMIGTSGQKPGMGRNIKAGRPVVAVEEGKMKDIATDKAEAERILGGPVKPKSSVVGGKGQPKNLRNLTSRLAARAMKAGGSVSEEVWDKPMPDSKKQGSLSPEQKAKAKARADRAGRSYPNMIDNMWASKQ